MAASIYDDLFGVARSAPDRPCLLLDDHEWTYGRLDRRAGQFVGALAQRGLTVGDRLVVQVDKSADAVALYLACLRTGVVHVPLNTAYTPTEVAFFATDAGAGLFVGRPGHRPPADVPADTLGGSDGGTLAYLADRQTDLPPVVERSGDDWAAMLYTSGTTGRSKGAMLSCSNLVANARALHDAWRFEPDDVLLHVLPIFHVHGLFVALHCAFLAGASVRFHERFDVESVRRDLRRSTVMMGVPTHYVRLLADPTFSADDAASMRLFTSGSAPLSAADHEAFTARTGHRIVERYGMTETMILTSNPYDGDRVQGTVGYPLAGVELRVTSEAGSPAAPGEVGTVEIRGDGVFLGYWQLPEKTADSYRDDGWFVTGDLGLLDASGRLTLVGRGSDLIISGGLNIYPKEIEAVLDAVDGVVETAVVGVPDPDFGEAVVAVVVATSGSDLDEHTLRSTCDEHLARFKHPKRYVVVDALPRNAMGKVQKAMLREQLRP